MQVILDVAMSKECYSHDDKDSHLTQKIPVGRNESGGHFQSSTSSKSRSPVSREQRFALQDLSASHQEMPQNRGQYRELELNQTFIRRDEKMAAVNLHNAKSGTQHESASVSSVNSPSVDGHSLYCTEVLPSSSPPSQPVAVDEGGAGGRGLVIVNGGAGSQPVQYTIIITDPHLQQNKGSNSSHTVGAANILFNSLIQQQEQHQLQQHLAAASKANNNNLKVGLPTNNTSFIFNSSNNKNSNKLSSLFINDNSLTSGSSFKSSPSTFPTNFIVNSLNNSFDAKSLQLANVTFTANSKLPATVTDNGSVEGDIVILNYSDAHLRPATGGITNISQFVSVHNNIQTSTNELPYTSSNSPNKDIGDTITVLSDDNSKTTGSIISKAYSSSVHPQLDVPVSFASLLLQDKQVSHDSDILVSNENNASSLELTSSKQNLLDPPTYVDIGSVGMHCGRTESGSGQAHTTHLQQQQKHNTINSSSTSTSVINQQIMLSAGQSALPVGIFRTSVDSDPHSPRFTGSGNYIHAHYPSVYGIHGQSGHLTTLQPYSTFFPGFGSSSASGHSICHGSVMTGAAQVHYPQVESYSAMLASMGSHVQHRSTQGADRTPRMQAPEAPVSQHISPFLPSTVHLSASVSQYPSIQSTLHHRLSDSQSTTPRSAVHNPTVTHQDPLSSQHLEKMASMKGSSSLQGREGEVSREAFYRNSSSLHEEQAVLSPSSYSSSGHCLKVSFDTVVKEYGGSRDCPPGRCDMYTRSSLSGKEGSLKHRILTRPSDSNILDDSSKVSGMFGLKDEPLTKLPKLVSVGSTSMTHSNQMPSAQHSDGLRSSSRHLPEAHTVSPHGVSKSSNTRETVTGQHSDNSLSKQHGQQHDPYQQLHSEDNCTDNEHKKKLYRSSPSITPPSISPPNEDHSTHLQYPCHFFKGSIIQLANGTLKRVEDLQTEDFVNSAEISSDLKVDSSRVVKIEENPDSGTAMLSFSVGEHQVQVTVEATIEHPFFVFGQGWSSCSVSRTLARYGLDCQKLNVGDVCISLTHKDVTLKAAEISQQHQPEHIQMVGPHHKLSITSGAEIPELQQSPSASSSVPALSTSSNLSSNSSSVLPSSLKLEHTNILHSSLTTPANASKIRQSQTELPPPSSNIVLVKKEANNNISKRRDSHRFESEFKEELFDEEDGESDSASSQCQRRYSSLDQVSVKADLEQERLKHPDTTVA